MSKKMMNPQRLASLAALCATWNKTDDGFAAIIRAGLDAGWTLENLANDFQVAISTVSRWANGLAYPLALVEQWVVGELERKAKAAMKAIPGDAKKAAMAA